MSSTEKGTISICFVAEALAEMIARGYDQNELLARAGIPPALLKDPATRVSANQYGALWHLIADILDDEFFGMGQRPMKRGSFTLLCHAIITSDTLERALHRALRFLRLVIDDVKGELRQDGPFAHIVLEDLPAHPSDHARPPKRVFSYSTFLVLLHGLSCWLIGKRIPLLQVDFRCAEPSFTVELKQLFSENMAFDRDHSGITFDSKYLSMKNIRDERSMKKFLRNAPANFLVRYKDLNSLSVRVRRHLREMPPENWPDFPALAEQLGLSSATLRRRLDSEGHSYRSITNELRKDLAIQLLVDGTQSTAEIAASLGFTEYSSFYRAFRKWTGSSPSHYRKTMSP